ncbi:CoA-acylating methylmalonate-semialdehyde dehydrogenase [Pacificibacter sp.]|uniref:CoA-acylating methylmalonate-semialdehyde dehydrogenase n=1 Tax=Pacificibacter sp. TaxID=1917866 RepID=UPI003219CA41
MKELTHYVNGAHVAGTSGRFADAYNPATGEVVARVPLATPAEIDAIVEKAAVAQEAWAKVNPQRRARVMMKFGALINDHMDELSEIVSREHGKTLPDARGDVQRGLEVVEVCMGAPSLLKGEYMGDAGPGIDLMSMRQALGVVAGITPFNFPAMIPLWKMAPAIACGNAMILKPSERAPHTALRLAELFSEAGLPDGVLQVVNGDKEAVDSLLDNDTIQAVGFVGSTPIAQYIYGRAAANGKRAQCFGGAKNHMIIMPDADLDKASDALIGAGFGAAGERCMAISVAVPVGKETADKLAAKLMPKIEALKVAPYTAGDDVDYGPVITAASKERIIGLINSGIEQGATLKTDGRDFSLQGYEDGYFVGPTFFDDVTPDMDIYKEEIFGPVLTQVRTENYEEGCLSIPEQYADVTRPAEVEVAWIDLDGAEQ